MPDPNQTGPVPTSVTPGQRLRIRRFNERMKLIASAVDRLSTVIFGGAVLAPIFQHTGGFWLEFVLWSLVAFGLHLIAHAVLGLIQEET